MFRSLAAVLLDLCVRLEGIRIPDKRKTLHRARCLLADALNSDRADNIESNHILQPVDHPCDCFSLDYMHPEGLAIYFHNASL